MQVPEVINEYIQQCQEHFPFPIVVEDILSYATRMIPAEVFVDPQLLDDSLCVALSPEDEALFLKKSELVGLRPKLFAMELTRLFLALLQEDIVYYDPDTDEIVARPPSPEAEELIEQLELEV